MGWSGTRDIVDRVYELHAWRRAESFLDNTQGVCTFFLEVPQTATQLNTNTLTDKLEALGLSSIVIETFPGDHNKTAAAAVFRMRNIILRSDGEWRQCGEHDKTLMRHLLTEQASAMGIGSSGGGGASFMSDAEFDSKTQAGFAASLKDLRSASDNIGTVANDIRTDMLRKPDLDDVRDSVDTAAAGIRDVVGDVRQAVVSSTADMLRRPDIAALEASISINQKTIDEFQLTIHNLQRNAKLDANTIFDQKTKIDQQAWRLNELRNLQTNYATLEKNFETQRAYAEMLARKVSELEIARNTLAHVAGDNVEGIIGDIATFLRGCKRTHSEMAAGSGV